MVKYPQVNKEETICRVLMISIGIPFQSIMYSKISTVMKMAFLARK
jgi:hypothetical protein